MYSGYRQIFWGLFLCTFHINIGLIQVIPAFIGWLIVAGGLYTLYDAYAYTSFRKAHYTVIAIAGISLFGFIADFLGKRYEILTYMPILIAIVEFLFIYYLLEGSIQYFLDAGEEAVAAGIKSNLQIYMLVFIFSNILGCIALTIFDQTLLFIYMCLAFILILWLMRIVSRLKKIHQEPLITMQESEINDK
ncbi:MAG: hypothetical protein PHF63_01835 [Herbinix sp.]|nr:hypothetical protein [Herbinix sp.]